MTNNNNSNSGLSQRALLVAVNISQWAGRKLDRKATETVNSTYKTSNIAGQYTKKLLPGANELEAVNQVAGQARKYFYEQTLPWMSDGTRIISAKNYLKFVSEMRKLKSDFEAKVKDFESAYPRLKANAAQSLGDLYNATEYPDTISDRFHLEVSYLPMPDAKDFRVEISEAEKREFQRKMRQVESEAMRDVWTRLHTVVKAAALKLSTKDAIFRDSLIENITEMTALLPMLNIANDSKLDAAAKEIDDLVSKLSPDTLRVNQDERDKASKALSDIESRMGAFMGKR
jgi:hypothetical protein